MDVKICIFGLIVIQRHQREHNEMIFNLLMLQDEYEQGAETTRLESITGAQQYFSESLSLDPCM